MPDKHIFEYAVIRYVPRVERQEFINLGVILFCKRKKFVGMRLHIDEARIRAFAPETDMDLLRSYLGGWEKICEGGTMGGKIGALDPPGRFRWLTAVRSSIIQSSQVHPGLCIDPAARLDRLFVQYFGEKS
ncbi:MAG: DUF3037 domain-containing protein [Bacteroidota bacterium]